MPIAKRVSLFSWIWALAERNVWNEVPPRRFWKWLLNWCDRRAGYHDGTPADVSGIGLGLTKEPDQTWLEAALAAAKPYGLETEIREEYDACIRRGESEGDAALHACMEWDVAMLFVDGKPAEPSSLRVEMNDGQPSH